MYKSVASHPSPAAGVTRKMRWRWHRSRPSPPPLRCRSHPRLFMLRWVAPAVPVLMMPVDAWRPVDERPNGATCLPRPSPPPPTPKEPLPPTPVTAAGAGAVDLILLRGRLLRRDSSAVMGAAEAPVAASGGCIAGAHGGAGGEGLQQGGGGANIQAARIEILQREFRRHDDRVQQELAGKQDQAGNWVIRTLSYIMNPGGWVGGVEGALDVSSGGGAGAGDFAIESVDADGEARFCRCSRTRSLVAWSSHRRSLGQASTMLSICWCASSSAQRPRAPRAWA